MYLEASSIDVYKIDPILATPTHHLPSSSVKWNSCIYEIRGAQFDEKYIYRSLLQSPIA